MELTQNYSSYSKEDHLVWSMLFERQNKAILKKASSEFQRGFKLLDLEHDRVARLEDVNEKLKKVNGWQVVGASGLVSNRDFFNLLINKRFPINLTMRTLEEINFCELPDIFHDIYGHIPMLLNPLFCQFMMDYSKLALEYIEDEEVVNYFGRLYWFTLEMGLVKEDGLIKPYGGAIMTSANEIQNIANPEIKKHPFDLVHVIQTSYDNLKLQKEYFVIDSFKQLFDSLEDIRLFLSEVYVPSEKTVL